MLHTYTTFVMDKSTTWRLLAVEWGLYVGDTGRLWLAGDVLCESDASKGKPTLGSSVSSGPFLHLKNCQRSRDCSVALYRLIEYEDLRRHSPQRYNRSVLFTSTVLSYLQTRWRMHIKNKYKPFIFVDQNSTPSGITTAWLCRTQRWSSALCPCLKAL